MIYDRAEQLMEEFPWMFIKVYQIENRFFGETVTVSGLLTGQDIIDQLRGKELGETLFLPCNVLKADEEIFLDDITLEELQNALQVKADIVKSDGKELILKLLDIRQEEDR
jgi:NifB/MoaA-like Fe-S oxidoreductase